MVLNLKEPQHRQHQIPYPENPGTHTQTQRQRHIHIHTKTKTHTHTHTLSLSLISPTWPTQDSKGRVQKCFGASSFRAAEELKVAAIFPPLETMFGQEQCSLQLWQLHILCIYCIYIALQLWQNVQRGKKPWSESLIS